MSASLFEQTLQKAKAENASPYYIEEIENYGNFLLEKNLPVIFNLHHLSLLMGVKYEILEAITRDSQRYYKTYKLRKKSGGFRWITAPNPELKYIQKWILHNILKNVKSHSNCFSFKEGVSIRKNAEPHSGSQLILTLDLYRFFDSITQRRVYGVLSWLGYSKGFSYDLAKLMTTKLQDNYWQDVAVEKVFPRAYTKYQPSVLPQGAPTSPILSNLIAFKLDLIFSKLATRLGCNYTRYADDITFSGAKKSIPSFKFVEKILVQEGFYLNKNKVHYLGNNNRQIVTGLVVNKKISVKREWKNTLRTELYHCEKKGVTNHLEWVLVNKGQPIKDNYKNYLYGKIRFLYSIEPLTAKKYEEIYNKIEWPS